MKKYILFILSSLMITGVSYVINSNRVFILDDVEALSFGDYISIPRKTTTDVDIHDGYSEQEKGYSTTDWIMVKAPAFVPPTATSPGYMTGPVYDKVTFHFRLNCCMESKNSTCDFAKDPNPCENVEGYEYPSQSSN